MPIARKVEKLVRSAAANAENNYNIPANVLRIKSVYADEGVRLDRYRAGPRGRVKPWVRRYSHITVVVEDRE
jgi:large subunit ribosomal protein L22